jgi:hypothetical protein
MFGISRHHSHQLRIVLRALDDTSNTKNTITTSGRVCEISNAKLGFKLLRLEGGYLLQKPTSHRFSSRESMIIDKACQRYVENLCRQLCEGEGEVPPEFDGISWPLKYLLMRTYRPDDVYATRLEWTEDAGLDRYCFIKDLIREGDFEFRATRSYDSSEIKRKLRIQIFSKDNCRMLIPGYYQFSKHESRILYNKIIDVFAGDLFRELSGSPLSVVPPVRSSGLLRRIRDAVFPPPNPWVQALVQALRLGTDLDFECWNGGETLKDCIKGIDIIMDPGFGEYFIMKRHKDNRSNFYLFSKAESDCLRKQFSQYKQRKDLVKMQDYVDQEIRQIDCGLYEAS